MLLSLLLSALSLTPDLVAGQYLERSRNQMDYYACQDSVEISFNASADSIFIHNLQGYGTTVSGTVDWSTGNLTFPHQTFLSGIIMDVYDDAGNWVGEETADLMFSGDSIPSPVTGRILDDGTVQLDQWLCETYFAGDDSWDWTYDLQMAWTDFVRPNAEMTTEDVFGQSHTYRVNIEYATDLQSAFITGFGGKAGIVVQVRSNGSLALEPAQYFYFYNFYYGYASIYSPTYNGTSLSAVNSIRYIHGTGDATTWHLDPWAVCYDFGLHYPSADWLTTSTTLRMTDGSDFVYPAASDYGWTGAGSAEDPYLLNTPDDFSLLASLVRGGNYFDGIYFRVGENIDFEGSTFSGVATNQSTTYSTNYRFEGFLDGAGHTLSNLHIGNPQMSHAALFGELRGTVQDLTIDSTCSVIGLDYVGAFAGDMKTTTDARLIRCRNYASVTGYGSYVGGLAGMMAKDHLADACYNAGTVTCYNCKVGGLVGYSFRATLQNCQNDGEVRILSGSYDNPLLAQAGGLCGYVCGSTITNCLNTGTVRGLAKVGGLCGEIYNNIFPTHFTSCVNLGAVLCDEAAQSGAITGYCTSTTTTAQAVYYDAQRQYCGAWQGDDFAGVEGLTTAALTGLTSDSSVSSLTSDSSSSSPWDLTPGLYPSLLTHAASGSDAFRRCQIHFAEGETAGDLLTSATLATGVTGSLAEGTCFALSNEGVLTVLPTSQPLVTDLLTLRLEDYETFVPLRHIATGGLSGSGTADDPYLILTASDWLTFVNEANIQHNDYAGEYLRLAADIDFTGIDYAIPYGDGVAEFQGHLLGDGHTLSGIHLDLGSQYTASSVSKGLVAGTCGAEGVIEGIRLSDCSVRGYETIGLVVGTLRGTLTDCQTDSLCYVVVENRYAGGLCGVIEGAATISHCQNHATVWSEQFLAGIAGYGASTQAQIIATENYGHIYNYLDSLDSLVALDFLNPDDPLRPRIGVGHVAGICSRFHGTMTDCQNFGVIESANGYAAGMTAKAYSGATLTGCVNHGDVSDLSYNMVTGYAAGIVCEATGPITACGNEGDIYSALNYVGGIVSSYTGPSITDTWNEGSVLAGNIHAGGIASNVMATGIEFRRCWNTGTIVAGCDSLPATESNEAGGIIGTAYDYEPLLSHCWNSGEVRCDKTPGDDGTLDYDADYDFTDAGGLCGSGVLHLEGCFNAGKVIAKKQVGGLVGRMSGGSITSSYNVGVVQNDTLPDYASHLIGHQVMGDVIDCLNVFYCTETDTYDYMIDHYFSADAPLTLEEFTAAEGPVTALGDSFSYASPLHFPMLNDFLEGSTAGPSERAIQRHAEACLAPQSEGISEVRPDAATNGSRRCYDLMGRPVSPEAAGRGLLFVR